MMSKKQEISFNKDFQDEMKILLNDQYDEFVKSYEKDRVKSITINPYKIKEIHFELLKVLNPIETGLNNHSYFVEVNQPLGQLPYYHAGLYYPQELSASAVVSHMGLKEDDWVLDMCAAPGGKSSQILSYIPQGLLLSNEINSQRAKVLVENLHRYGAKNVIVTNNDVTQLPNHLFDHVLLDAPCTGESMIKRFPDLVNQYSINSIKKAQKLQIELFREAINKVKDGGRITYSTCTFNRMENEMVIESILSEYDNVELVNMNSDAKNVKGINGIGLRYYPHIFGEGHFIAQVIVHKDSDSKAKLVSPKKYEIKDQVFDIDIEHPDLSQLNPLIVGIPLLSNQKPHWANPLVIGSMPDINLNLEQSYLYLNGQVLSGEQRGYQKVGLDGLGLGWVKGSNSQLKNHYPKNLRNRFSTMKKP